jgi:hypothetical protein
MKNWLAACALLAATTNANASPYVKCPRRLTRCRPWVLRPCR